MSGKIKLYRTKPYALLCYEALFRALKPQYRNHQVLLNEYSHQLAGYQGEKYADYTVSIYPHKNAYIYQGIRLKSGSYYFQIDTLIVTPCFTLIIEIKNWKREIEYNSNTHQTTQYDGKNKIAYKSPVLQANNQKLQFSTWLQKYNFPTIPIETIAVLSNPSTILTYIGDSDEFYKRFILLDHLPSIFDQHYSSYNKQILSRGTMDKLNHTLLTNNTPYKPGLIEQYGITDKHLVKGIACNDCNHYPLIYSQRKWCCPNCGLVDKFAHVQKIYDYFLLFDTTITNQKCREILQLPSSRVAYRLLNSMGLKYTGKNSARKYASPRLEDFPQDANYSIRDKALFSTPLMG